MLSQKRASTRDKSENTGVPEVKYPNPSILLMDLSESVMDSLTSAGYNILCGSFGIPHKVEQSTDYARLPLESAQFPTGFAEADIVIVDLMPEANLPDLEPGYTPGINCHWSQCDDGVIDPRPVMMDASREQFERILSHGGIFIVFATRRIEKEVVFGHKSSRGHLFLENNSTPSSNWAFLEVLHQIHIEPDRGNQIVVDKSTIIANALSEQLPQIEFDCTLQPSYISDDNWKCLAENKYGQCVASIVAVPNNNAPPGLVLIFPRIGNQSQFLLKLLGEALPEISPRLFPHIEGKKWVTRVEYELLEVMHLKEQIIAIKEEAEQRVEQLEQDIEAERTTLGYLHDLITETGDTLVASVKKALHVLGFPIVRDMDKELRESGSTERFREDLQIEADSLVLVEAKGIGGTPKDEDVLQVGKYIPNRMRQLDRTDIRGLSIINYQRHMPALDRAEPFDDDVIEAARIQQIGLLTAFDFYRLVRSYVENGWRHEHIRGLFFQDGRVFPVPLHYQLIGTIEKFWEDHQAIGIRLEAARVEKGARIAIELPTVFREQDVASLQVEGRDVDFADPGEPIGIVVTGFSKSELKNGTRVYLVNV